MWRERDRERENIYDYILYIVLGKSRTNQMNCAVDTMEWSSFERKKKKAILIYLYLIKFRVPIYWYCHK